MASLPEHLHPKTYWEERCELMEESIFRLMTILANTALPQNAVYEVNEHMRDWNRLLGELTNRFPAPEKEGE